MGDKLTDLPHESDVPPVPLKTYQWEDIRRQKLEGRYPWTYLYKPPFNEDNWDKSKEHEYEPVIPMDSMRKASPLPALEITTEKESFSIRESESPKIIQDKHHLCIPEDSDDDDSDEEDLSEEITAEELQQRLEERFFRSSPSSSKHDYEFSETRSVSPALSDRSRAKSDTSGSFHDRMQVQADKIKQKFKNFKEQISKEHQTETPAPKSRKNQLTDSRKRSKPAKKNKFNFRRHNVKSQDKLDSQSSNKSKSCTPQLVRRFSLPRLPSFSRSRSSSVKERERKRSQSSETDSKKFFDFHFGTYPRVFGKKKKSDEKPEPVKVKPRSAPATPTQRRSPFPQRWISKFIDHKKEETPKKEAGKEKKMEKRNETVVKESIFISLHEDPVTGPVRKQQIIVETEPEPTDTKNAPTDTKIDNKNFIFISLHEERFPEKLRHLEEEKHNQEMLTEELEIEKELGLHQAETSRKLHMMLRRLQTDRKMKARRAVAAARDDKPEPVVITEVTDECGDQTNLNLSSDIEQPEDEWKTETVIDNIPAENYKFEKNVYKSKARTFHKEANNSSENRLVREISVNESSVEELPIPQKAPRKKFKNFDSDKESKESLSAFEDSVFVDVVTLNEKQLEEPVMMKTYIKAGLDEIILNENSVEPEQTTRHFKEYEKALEKSRSQSSFEIENNFYSNTNSLARLETPIPPTRSSRIYSTARKKKEQTEPPHQNKENYYDLDVNTNYNTFPIVKPDKPCRKYRKKRTYSNSTTNTEIKRIEELEDETINNNIVNSKQLSVSFLPLSSNVVGEPIIDYNLRETSSMIHLNLPDPPLPPKRKKNRSGTSPDRKFNSLPNHRYYSKASLTPSEIDNNLDFQIDGEIEYADDVNSTVRTDTPPRRPYRKRNPSLPDDDRTSREVESLPSERSQKTDVFFNDHYSNEVNGYVTIETPESRRESKTDSLSLSRRISRRFSDFFTLPRIRTPTNYVPLSSQTLDRRRCPSPSRPPRRNRPNHEHLYTNDELTNIHESTINFSEEEQLNFNLATEEDSPEREDPKNLETDDVFKKMQSRPLPPPPRPTRKPKDDNKPSYSQCKKRKPINETNDLSENIEEKIMNNNDVSNVTRSTWSSWERKTTVREFEIRDGERREISTPVSQTESKKEHVIVTNPQEPKQTNKSSTTDNQAKNEQQNEYSNLGARSNNSELVRREFFTPTTAVDTLPSGDLCSTKETETAKDTINVITATQLNVSELNVGRINVNEIDTSKIVTSNVESSTMQVSDVQTETGRVVFNSVNYSDCTSVPEQCHILDVTATRGTTPSNEDIESAETASIRSRFSSMIPEVGSDEECSSKVTKVKRPARRKQLNKREEIAVPQIPSERNPATLAELMCQILQICYNSVGQAINSLLEQVIPEDREKRNEVHAAIWVITIIVAGCLMLGLQSNEKVVHHHHWDFHFPPPH